MKKTLFLVCLGMFMVSTTFSQMSFTGNKLKKTSFDLTAKKTSVLDENVTTSKVFITDEENDMMKKRRKRGGRSDNDDFGILLYSQVGISVPLGGLSDATSFGFFTQGIIEGVFQNKFAVGLSFGEYLYFGKSTPVENEYGYIEQTDEMNFFYMMPLAVTFKYFLKEDEFKPYVGVDLGLMFNGGDMYDEPKTKFGGTPRVGFIYCFADIFMAGLDASYNIIENGNGLNFGVQFGFIF